MKLVHLSDLHIGKRLEAFSFLEDQQAILNQILQIIDDEAPEAVLIAGDVYDKSVPSAEAVAVYDFLCRLAKRRCAVMIISGNHDSPERLAFGGRLLEKSGIHISPVYQGQVEPVTLEDQHGPVDFWLLPFIKPSHVKRFFPEVESYTDACRGAVEAMALRSDRRNVLLTHQFVTGAATCESEELSVGGTDNVDASVFDAFDYVALGHIHGPQNIGSNRIRYCGTPLKYSFSEVNHHKSVTVVELGEKGALQVQVVPLTPKQDLRRITGTFQEISQPEETTRDYLHVILTDEEDIPDAMGRLRLVYPNIMKLSYDNTRTRQDNSVEDAADVKNKSPLELFGELYETLNNRPMSPEQEAYTRELIETIWEEEP